MGGSVADIIQRCEALQSDHVLLFSLVYNVNPDLIAMVSPELRERMGDEPDEERGDAPERRQAFGNRPRQSLRKLAHGVDARADCPKTDRYGRLVCSSQRQKAAGLPYCSARKLNHEH